MSTHISTTGIDEDDDGFVTVRCDCGSLIGPAPDPETVLDLAMEHAYAAGLADGLPEPT